jgi:hypothetical protein
MSQSNSLHNSFEMPSGSLGPISTKENPKPLGALKVRFIGCVGCWWGAGCFCMGRWRVG